MFNEEIRNMLIQVITSWQVIAVTVALVFYIFIVNSVARLYRRRRHSEIPPMPKEKKEPLNTAPPSPDTVQDDDELGLEEETPKK